MIYTFERKEGFYPLELDNDLSAIKNAECNPGTVRVTNEVTGVVVWDEKDQFVEVEGRKLALPACPGGTYLGNCIDCCSGHFSDATEMAQFIENSKVAEAYDDRIVGVNGNLKWIHDLDEDVHFFFEITP